MLRLYMRPLQPATVIGGFLAGCAISVAGCALTVLRHVPGPVALAVVLAAFFLGGMVAGASVGQTMTAALGFGVAFTVGNVAGMLSLVSTQATSGPAPLIVSSVMSAIVFGAAGAVGLGIANAGRQTLHLGVVGFTLGGLASGVLVAALLNARLIGGSPEAVLAGFAIPMMLPWIVGAVAIARAGSS